MDSAMNNARAPNSGRHDFEIGVSAVSLRQAREDLFVISKARFRLVDLWLTLASLAGGAILAAVLNGGSLQQALWWPVLVAITAGGFVAYLLLSILSTSQPAAKAQKLLWVLPDPDKEVSMFEETEQLAGEWKLESVTATSRKKSSGVLNIDVTRGRISAAGQLYGESGTQIAEIASQICDYEPRTRQLLLIYRLSAQNDDGTQLMTLCVLSGIVFQASSQEDIIIRGNWFHIQGIPDGSRLWGTATLTLQRTLNS